MITVPLRIRWVGRPHGDIAAWYIPGANPADWVSELSTWQNKAAKVDVFLIPRSRRDRRPCGVLLVPPAGLSPMSSSRAMPYRVVGNRLYLPADAQLAPEFSANELDRALVGEWVVFHPGLGLVGFSTADRCHVTDLFTVPHEQKCDWDRAQPGVPSRLRLLAVQPDLEETVESLIESGRDDIGFRPLSELPERPGEPGTGIAHRAARAVQYGLARVVAGLASGIVSMMRAGSAASGGTSAGQVAPGRGISGAGAHVPPVRMNWLARSLNWLIGRRGSGPVGSSGESGRSVVAAAGMSWPERLRQWAWQKLQRVTAAMQSARNRELDRLLHLFDTDPDEALRYAAPLAGAGGVPSGPAGTRLVPQDAEFQIARLGGTFLADPWHADWRTRQRLLQKYRELADRELRLGRHRRAAYILANLLGDFAAAAGALVQGNYFREAAILYRDFLRRPLDAAQCFERAGLWIEAIEIYNAHQEFEKAGDLYRRLDQPEEAEGEYRRAVELYRRNEDLLSAATVLANKLEAHDEALTVLTSAWPWSRQARKCMEMEFAIRGEIARHDEAIQRINQLCSGNFSPNSAVILAEALARESRIYPDVLIRTAAADATRVVAGRHLSLWPVTDASPMIDAVVSLEPHDRLLARDGKRFLTRCAAPQSAAPRGVIRERPPPVVILRTFQLPGDTEWKFADSTGQALWVAGVKSQSVVIARCTWSGQIQAVTLSDCRASSDAIALAPDPNGIDPTWVFTPSDLETWNAQLVAIEPFPRSVLVKNVQAVRHFAVANHNPIAIAYNDGGTLWVLSDAGTELILNAYRSNRGDLLTTRRIPLSPDVIDDLGDQRPLTATIFVQRETIYLGYANYLFTLVRDRMPETTVLLSRVTGIVGTSRHMRPRVAITTELGGSVRWGGFERNSVPPLPFATDMSEPLAAFTRHGNLVAIGSGRGEIYSTNNRTLDRRADFRVTEHDHLAVLATNVSNEFAAVRRDGTVSVYSMDH